MREDYLAEALQEVSAEHIMEAALPLRKRRRWSRAVMGFAACFAVLAVGSFFLWPMLSGSTSSDEAAMDQESAADFFENAESIENGSGYVSDDWDSGTDGDYAPMDWGVTLRAEDATSTGLTLVIERSGDASAEELSTGSRFFLQREEDGRWADVPYPDGAPDWTDALLVIPTEGALRQQVSWEGFYGALEAGQYRIGKEISAAASGESTLLWAEFRVE